MLAGKVCIGGGHGIGVVTATELGQYGATVIVNDLGTDVHGSGENEVTVAETVAAVEDVGGSAFTHFGDVRLLSYVDSLVSETVEEFG